MLHWLNIAVLALAPLLFLTPGQHAAAQGAAPFVLAVELEIAPPELDNYKAAIKENGQASVRDELGCREFNIVFEKDNPTRVLLFEVYDSADAYAAHQASAHFKKYADATASMIKSRKRIEMVPVGLYAKTR
jgi:quinol monooxygenase YgiN